MKKVFVALVLSVILSITSATPALAGDPPDKKPMPVQSIQGLLWACAAKAINWPSLGKPNPGLGLSFSTKAMIDFELIGTGTPVALGYWWKKPH